MAELMKHMAKIVLCRSPLARRTLAGQFLKGIAIRGNGFLQPKSGPTLLTLTGPNQPQRAKTC
jgi:hypothetical protein